MWNEFLEDYQESEIAHREKSNDDLGSGKITLEEYKKNELRRFQFEVKQPLIIADRHSYNFDEEKIWSQIPFAGTLIVPIVNASKENFLKLNGFDISDIPNLTNLSKNQHKIQFVLTAMPSLYQNLTFLEELFHICKPPCLFTIPMQTVGDTENYQTWKISFHDLAKPAYFGFLQKSVLEIGEDKDFFENTVDHFAMAYARAKLLKQDELVDVLDAALIDNPAFANFILSGLITMTDPIFNGLGCGTNMTISKMKMFNPLQGLNNDSAIFPVDIGTTLMKKLTYLTPSYEACIDIMSKYKDNDLYKLLENLHHGIMDKNKDEVIKKRDELGVVVDNIWKDSDKIRTGKTGITTGISLTLGAVGTVASSLLTGSPFGGILASCGFLVADKVMELTEDKLGKRLASYLNKDYLVNIYDFKQKHNLSD